MRCSSRRTPSSPPGRCSASMRRATPLPAWTSCSRASPGRCSSTSACCARCCDSRSRDAANADELPFRVGRRIVWVGEALEPLRGSLSPPEHERLVLAIAAAVGIDALVWMTDVAGLTRPQAVDLMCWSARALLRAALDESA